MIAGGRLLAAMAAGAMLAIANGTASADPCKNHYILEEEDPCWGFEAPTPPALNIARRSHASVRLHDGTVLVTGGSTDRGMRADEIYDPAQNRWIVSSPFNVPRAGHTVTLLADGRVLAVGGSAPSAEIFDPALKVWIVTGEMIMPRGGHTATLLQDGRVLIAGGWGSDGTPVFASEIYDPVTSTFVESGPLIRARSDHTATLLQDGRVLVVRGTDADDFYDTIATAELYDPATGAWSPAGALARGSIWHTATLLRDGRVLVTGGYGGWVGTRPLRVAEIYDPADGGWTRAADMHVGRHQHSALAMPDGRVVIAGGIAISADLKVLRGSSVEVFDLATSAWSERDDLNMPRSGHTATLLRDGRMLIVGGTTVMPGSMTLLLSSVEAYRP